MRKINIEKDILYEFNKPKDRTRKRLIEMSELGMEEVGFGEFGYKDIMSGLYIEQVWNYTDDKFDDYMNWVKEVIELNKKSH